jgi:hypothetical protein
MNTKRIVCAIGVAALWLLLLAVGIIVPSQQSVAPFDPNSLPPFTDLLVKFLLVATSWTMPYVGFLKAADKTQATTDFHRLAQRCCQRFLRVPPPRWAKLHGSCAFLNRSAATDQQDLKCLSVGLSRWHFLSVL